MLFVLFTIIDTISVSREFKYLSKQIIRSLNNHSLGYICSSFAKCVMGSGDACNSHTLQQK